ncbi:hypothetical protein IAR55_001990 [Kwoniella newhampshirensis]|uniref:C2H2-type domain-containing protein n=1 Tax=Kwoniella newhampshirensis TaxID=1651941 RepID=A0AAW0Z3Y3_9TREE
MEAGPSCYRCTYTGCSKTFTRKDHLHRHAANHSEETHDCERCGREFKRPDLLQRHEKRNICGEASASSSLHYGSKRRRTSESEDTIRPVTASTLPRSSEPSSALTSPPIALPVVPSTNTANNPQSINDNNGAILPSAEVTQSDFVIGDFFGDWGGVFAPENWETLVWESLAPPFNETLMVDMPWDITLPRMQQESAERGQDNNVASVMLIARLQRSFPDFDVPLSFVIEALASYWTHTAPTFPFIHRGTFDLNAAPPELVIMMAIIGSVHMTPRHDFSKLVQKIRGVLVQECGLDMAISTLQAFCLCHVHDTWYSTAESQFVAQCMWPVMVAHSRKKGIGVLGKPDSEVRGEEAWSAWAKEEERRRAAYCVLLIDTQLSAFWNQHCSRQLSIFAHNLILPCPRNEWDALTAHEWLGLRGPTAEPATKPKTNRSGYLPGLHPEFEVSSVAEGYSSAILATLGAQKLSFRVDLDNNLTVQMVLIGLLAIAWDCRTRGGMGIRFREGTKQWRSIVFNALINLRAAYEESLVHMSSTVESRDMRDTFAIGIISILSDIPMLHVAAGSTSFCGATIGPRQYADAKRRLRLWAKTDDSWTCVWQCARYLRQTLFSEWGLYTPWAVFLTTLVCWAYSWTCAKGDDLPNVSPSTSYHPRRDRDIHRHALHLPQQHHASTSSSSTTSSHLHFGTTTTTTTTTTTAGIAIDAQPSTKQDRQRTIIDWLDKILRTNGRCDTLDGGEVEEVIECVADKISEGESIARENATLLRRLMGSGRRRG